MYFRASQLPQLSSLCHRERCRVLVSAAVAYNRWVFLRMAVVFVLMLATITAINFLPLFLRLPGWAGTAAAVICGMLFYALLLWEFNGPLGKAVAKYLSGSQSNAPPA